MPDIHNIESTASAISEICNTDEKTVISGLKTLVDFNDPNESFIAKILNESREHAFQNFDDTSFSAVLDKVAYSQKPSDETERNLIYFLMLITRTYQPRVTDEDTQKTKHTLQAKFNTLVNDEFDSSTFNNILKCLDVLHQMDTERGQPLLSADYTKAREEKSDPYLRNFYREYGEYKKNHPTSEQTLDSPLEYFARTKELSSNHSPFN